MQSYDYSQRKGIEEISWSRFAALSAQLAEQLAEHKIEMVVGIARAGLFPATLVACSLRCDLTPVRVTRRANDQVVCAQPTWKVDVSPEVGGKQVAVIDEIADTGETLAIVADRVRVLGAKQVLTAVLIGHSWAKPAPEVVALVTDALVLFPWDRQVYAGGRWQEHPELVTAKKMQDSSD